jgi:putative ABC transport system permease protein
MNKMVVANLMHRPVRSLISIVAIAVEVTLILVVVGLLLGILNDSKERQAGVGADVLVQPPGTSFLSGLTGLPAPAAIANILRTVPHVSGVAPIGIFTSTTKRLETIDGIDLASFESVAGPLRYLSGGPFQGSNDVLVDDVYADANHVKVGSQIEVLNHPFKVVGIVEHGKLARLYIQLKTMQDYVESEGKASIFYVKVDNPTDENVERVVDAIKQIPGMSEYQVRSMKQWLTLMTPENLPGLSTVIDLVIAVAMIIGFIVIFQAMYTAVMERTREIGILKSLGASKFYITNLMLRETVLLAAVGTVLGIGISFATKAMLHAKLPLLIILIQTNWLGYAAVIAIVGAILGAVYPAFKAAQKDPIEALAYE